MSLFRSERQCSRTGSEVNRLLLFLPRPGPGEGSAGPTYTGRATEPPAAAAAGDTRTPGEPRQRLRPRTAGATRRGCRRSGRSPAGSGRTGAWTTPACSWTGSPSMRAACAPRPSRPLAGRPPVASFSPGSFRELGKSRL